MLKIQQFIKEHSNWEELLSNKPFCLKITRNVINNINLIMFKYSQIDSDFSNDIVCESRGLILNEDTFEIVSYPFNKFFNYGEQYAANIDWSSCFVSDKLDGSIIKLTKIGKNNFLISTNGTIDAFKAEIHNSFLNSVFKNYGELVLEGFKYYGINYSDFNKYFEDNYTYIFELTSPFNKIVVPFKDTKVSLIGIRNNKTLKEEDFRYHKLSKIFETPKVFNLRTISECIEAASKLDYNSEGYVICDKNFNRIKVKSPFYLELHYMKGNGILSKSKIISILKSNEIDEILSYFPEFKTEIYTLKQQYDNYLIKLNNAQTILDNWIKKVKYYTGNNNRKIAAKFIMDNLSEYSNYAFLYLDKKILNFKEHFDIINNDVVAKIIFNDNIKK